jgi:hypothetical protein
MADALEEQRRLTLEARYALQPERRAAVVVGAKVELRCQLIDATEASLDAAVLVVAGEVLVESFQPERRAEVAVDTEGRQDRGGTLVVVQEVGHLLDHRVPV